MKKLIIVFFVLIFNISCTNDDDIKIHTELLGEYKFLSYTSNIPLDLDFDNIKDTNLLNEFDYFTIYRSSRDAMMRYAEQGYNNGFSYSINLINFPSIWPNRIYLDEILSESYDSVFINLDRNAQVQGLSRSMPLYPTNGRYFFTTAVEFLPNKNLKINGKQKLYDFELNEWVEVEIEAILEKK